MCGWKYHVYIFEPVTITACGAVLIMWPVIAKVQHQLILDLGYYRPHNEKSSTKCDSNPLDMCD